NTDRLEEARSRFEGALELDINYAPAWRGLALVHLKRKEFDTAVREARRAFELDPSMEHRVLLVQSLYEGGERPAAYRLLQEEIAAKPGDQDLRAFYATLLFNEKLYRECEKELRQVLAAAPGHLPARQTLVLLLVQTGRPGEAADQCREAVKLSPGDPRFLLLLRDLLVDEGDFGGAAAAVKELSKLDLPEAKRKLVEEDLQRLLAAAADPSSRRAPDPEKVLQRLDSPDVLQRREAMRTLWEQELNFLPDAAVRRISDIDETVRLYAAKLLGRYGSASAAGLLEVVLFHPKDRDGSVQVRAQAALSMAEIGGVAVLPVLFRALEEPEPEVLRSAVLGIRRTTGKCFVEDPFAPVPEAERPALRDRYRRWWMEEPTGRLWRRKAAAAAGDSGMRSLVAYAVPWVLEEDPAMRAAALDAVARLRKDPGYRDLPTATMEERAAARERLQAALVEAPAAGGGR
ncbi:MAG: HEAT repeat domain-containing protein, partial [Planctomycetes bacterium]|nr:HEAT repeat domain-containing protein [Planctomycetota bacterium]